ncbi:MAG: aldo/keto reductase [Microthrixaceae bacterium]
MITESGSPANGVQITAPTDGQFALSTQRATRRLGSSELFVGPISYGCWRMAEGDRVAARATIETALAAGWTLIDTADIYGFDGQSGFGRAEILLGEVLAETPELREQMVLATKGGISPGVPYDSSAQYLTEACEASVRRLGVEVIDLYQIHRPDVLTHPEEIAAGLMDLHKRGLVKEFGLSNVTPSQFRLVQSYLDRPLVSTQPEFSVWHSQPVSDGTFDQCLELGVTPLAWSPLGGGRVSAKSSAALGVQDDPAGSLRQVLAQLAQTHGVSEASIALAYVLAHPSAPIPIIGTQRPERILESAESLTLKLSRQEWYSLYQAGTGEQLP